MRKILLGFITLCISLSSFCQEMFISNDTAFERQTVDWYYTGIIKVDSTTSKDILFQKARQWFSETFVSAKAVIDNEDKPEGVIYGKGNIKMAKDVDGRVKFTIEIRCKDGKVKYILSNFNHEGACIINVYGTCATGSNQEISLGPLTQSEILYSYAISGRTKTKWWNSIKNQTKSAIFKIVNSLNDTFKKEGIKEKDSW